MIARIPHDTESGRVVFVPARFDHEEGEWVPIQPDAKPCESSIDAARVCLADIVAKFAEIEYLATRLRALCHHGVNAESVEPEMIRREADTVVNHLYYMGYDLTHLLHECPDAEETIRIGDRVLTGADLAKLADPQATE